MSTAYYGRAVPLALRRFAKLPCRLHGRRQELVLPEGLPTGVHVVMLMTRRKHIEHADSWLGVRAACERLLTERGIALKGEMQMYICCLLPRFWPLRWVWRYRMWTWASLLEDEEHKNVHILSSTTWPADFFHRMTIHNDGRAHTMVDHLGHAEEVHAQGSVTPARFCGLGMTGSRKTCKRERW
ncbi:unnamed protein product [Effrenium voratum]|nr:unnamed protein product [Effrenium voratum]